jgi:parallel beta-helix repeat protein
MSRRIVVPALLLVCADSLGAAAEEVTFVQVPGDFASIQQAIDAVSKNGRSTVRVQPGTYEESLVISGFLDLTIQAEGATLVSSGPDPAVTACASEHVRIEGLSIRAEGVGLAFAGLLNAEARNVRVLESGSHGFLVADIGTMTVVTSPAETHQVYKGEVVLADCSAAQCGGDGIRMTDEAHVQVARADIRDVAGDGVHAEPVGGVLTLGGTTIVRAGGDGVDSSLATTHVEAVRIEDAGGDGVVIRAGDRAYVRQTTVTRAGGRGIAADEQAAPPVQVEYSEVQATARDGIAVRTGDLARNTVSGAGGAGIRVEAAVRSWDARIDGNVVSGAAGPGIDLAGSHGVRVFGNTVTAAACGFRLGHGAAANLLRRNVAEDCPAGGLDVSPAAKRNRIARSNRFGARHRR